MSLFIFFFFVKKSFSLIPFNLNIRQFNLIRPPYNSNTNYLNKLPNKSNIPQQPKF